MIFGDVKKYRDYRKYFADFAEANKSQRDTLTSRNLSTRIGWPAPFLSDLLNGHKKLSPKRALQFARFANLSLEDTSYLYFLSVLEGASVEIGSYARKMLDTLANGKS